MILPLTHRGAGHHVPGMVCQMLGQVSNSPSNHPQDLICPTARSRWESKRRPEGRLKGHATGTA